jgi:tetratricopeptide (TPR) repeat protein
VADESDSANSKSVSRSQYDQLLVKYEELSKKYEQLKEKPSSSQGSLADELQNTQSDNFAQSASNTEAETVNVFPESQNSQATTEMKVPEDVNSQLSLFRRGLALKSTNQSEATKIFQQLETHGIPPVKVRAKYQIGSMLLEKGQFDLALQVFEDIINKHSESGVVLDALQGAVVASDKLGVVNKKDQYSSMLNDVFGSGQGM